jgi:OmpA-OmpF porin, OOP family
MRKSVLLFAGFVGIPVVVGCGGPEPAVVVRDPGPPVAVAVATPAPVEPVIEKKPRRRRRPPPPIEGNRLRLPGPIVFRTGSDEIDPVSHEILEIVFDYMFEKPEITLLRVEGHTDNVGGTAPNQQLSERRAMSVVRFLIGKGLDCRRIIPVGFGETKPIASNATDSGKAENRRTEFHNAELRGKAIGGLPKDGGGRIAGDPCVPR